MTTTTSVRPYLITLTDRKDMVEVRCGKNHLIAKATRGAVVETKCNICKTIVTAKATSN